VVLADQAGEDLPALDPGGDIDTMAGLALRRLLPRALVRTVAVVVPGVLGQDAAEMPLAEDQQWSRHSRRSVPTNHSAYEFARGDRTGVFITRVPFPAKTPSNAAANSPSRSQIRNRKLLARSPRSIIRLRAC
jgi:hypothetical protein